MRAPASRLGTHDEMPKVHLNEAFWERETCGPGRALGKQYFDFAAHFVFRMTGSCLDHPHPHIIGLSKKDGNETVIELRGCLPAATKLIEHVSAATPLLVKVTGFRLRKHEGETRYSERCNQVTAWLGEHSRVEVKTLDQRQLVLRHLSVLDDWLHAKDPSLDWGEAWFHSFNLQYCTRAEDGCVILKIWPTHARPGDRDAVRDPLAIVRGSYETNVVVEPDAYDVLSEIARVSGNVDGLDGKPGSTLDLGDTPCVARFRRSGRYPVVNELMCYEGGADVH